MKKPTWMTTILTRSKCVACETQLTEAPVIGVGISQPPSKKHALRGPAALLVVCCPQCAYCQVLLGYAPQRSVFLKVIDDLSKAAWKQYLDSQSQAQPGEPCPFDGLKMGLPVCESPAPPEPSGDPGAPDVPRPSIRPCTPDTPITEAEQRRFIRRLHRVPLRRTSKGFRAWLRRMTQ